MASEDTNDQAHQSTPVGQAILVLASLGRTIELERNTNGLGERGRALSLALTKIDEARMWVEFAQRL